MIRAVLTAIALMSFLGAGASQAAPDWCRKSGLNLAESTICNSVLLLTLDDQLNAAYVRALSDNPEQQMSLRQEQINWIAIRNACAQNDLCLHREYTHQIEHLRSLHR